MGRNKFAGPLSKREKKLKEEGKFQLRPDGHKGGGLWFFARYTKGYYGKIFLGRGPRQERSTLDAATAARTVRCAGEASAGARARRPSCDK